MTESSQAVPLQVLTIEALKYTLEQICDLRQGKSPALIVESNHQLFTQLGMDDLLELAKEGMRTHLNRHLKTGRRTPPTSKEIDERAQEINALAERRLNILRMDCEAKGKRFDPNSIDVNLGVLPATDFERYRQDREKRGAARKKANSARRQQTGDLLTATIQAKVELFLTTRSYAGLDIRKQICLIDFDDVNTEAAMQRAQRQSLGSAKVAQYFEGQLALLRQERATHVRYLSFDAKKQLSELWDALQLKRTGGSGEQGELGEDKR